MSDNWIVGNLQSAFNTWNDKLAEIWSLITTTPQEFRGGDIWTVIVGINDGLKAVGYGLLAQAGCVKGLCTLCPSDAKDS